MNGIKAIFKKEMKLYMNSPIAYIVVLFFLVVTSVTLYFIQNFLVNNTASLRSYFEIMPFLFVLLIPAITMRIWAEEKRMGTEELLLTLPFKEYEIVIGKYLSGMFLIVITLMLTLPIPFTLGFLGSFDIGQIFCEYFGILLLASAAISLGQFISSLSKNQIIAFMLSALVLLVVVIINQTTRYFNIPGWGAAIINLFSLNHHYAGFVKGVIDTRDVLYFGLISFLFLYLNTKILVLKKWK